jgi:hypothetical protein
MRAQLPRDSDIFVRLYFVLLLIYGVNHIMSFTILIRGIYMWHVGMYTSGCIHSRVYHPRDIHVCVFVCVCVYKRALARTHTHTHTHTHMHAYILQAPGDTERRQQVRQSQRPFGVQKKSEAAAAAAALLGEEEEEEGRRKKRGGDGKGGEEGEERKEAAVEEEEEEEQEQEQEEEAAAEKRRMRRSSKLTLPVSHLCARPGVGMPMRLLWYVKICGAC